MRFNVFSLFYVATLVLGSSFFTLKALAEKAPHAPSRNPSAMVRVHLLENLDEGSLKQVMRMLKDRGFNPVRSPIFSESDTAIVVTKGLGTEDESPSLKVELVRKDQNTIPVTLAVKQKSTANIQDVAGLLPEDPSALFKATAFAGASAR